MKFANKIAWAVGGASCVLLVSLSILFYCYTQAQLNRQFLEEVHQISKITSATLVQLDQASDLTLNNAAQLLREKAVSIKRFDMSLLRKWISEFNISNIYIADRDGKYIFSTHEPLDQLPNLFSFNSDFKKLRDSNLIIQSGIIPSLQLWGGYKFASFSSFDRKYIFEISLEGTFLGSTLQNSLKGYSQLEKIELFAGNGSPLYCVGKHQKTECSPFDSKQVDKIQDLGDYIAFSTRVLASNPDNGEQVKLAGPKGEYCYYLRVSVSKDNLIQNSGQLFRWAISILGVILCLVLCYSRWISRSLSKQINAIGSEVQAIVNSNDLKRRIPVFSKKDEIGELAERVNRMVERLQVDHEKVVEVEKLHALGLAAAQVAHDVRSPLSALEASLEYLSPLPEDVRLLVKAAVVRIKDICNNLISQNSFRSTKGRNLPLSDTLTQETETQRSVSVASLIHPLISEKRQKYKSKSNIQIRSAIGAETYPLFLEVNAADFSRVLSNLIDNAVDAIEAAKSRSGEVVVSVSEAGGRIIVSCSDTGAGIPSGIINQLGEKGFTFNKVGGSGLGLYHAKTTLEKWNGSLNIESKQGEGSHVSLNLPRANPPQWFVPSLIFRDNTQVLVLDDDSSVHQIWKTRFKFELSANTQIDLMHFTSVADFKSFVSLPQESVKKDSATYLIDFELIGSADNGLDLIELLGIGKQAILVTSRFEELKVIRRCESLSVRMIPKSSASFVPIVIETV